MNRKQYSILKWMLNVGAEPNQLASRLKLELSEVIAVQQSDKYETFDAWRRQADGSMDELIRRMFGGAFGL